MYKNTKIIIKRILDIIADIESYEFYKKNILKTTDKLYHEYQEGKYSYDQYKKLLQFVLKGKSRKEWEDYYNAYIYTLLKQIEPLISQIVYSLVNDKSSDNLEIKGSKSRETKIELEEKEMPQEAEVSDYEFVDVKRPSIIAKLRETIKPKDIHPEIQESDEENLRLLKQKKRQITEEDIEKRKSSLSNLLDSMKTEESTAKPRKKSLFSEISDYLFFRGVEKRRKSIEKKIKKTKPSLLSRIYYGLSYKFIKPAKAKPVKHVKPSLLSKIFPAKPALFKKRSEDRSEDRIIKDIPSALKPQRPAFFSNILLKARLALLKVLPGKKRPEKTPVSKKKFFTALKGAVKPEKDMINLKPEEDQALKKLVDHVDKINKEISTLKPKSTMGSASIKLKIMIIKMHYSLRSLFGKKKVSKKVKEAEKPQAISQVSEEVPLPEHKKLTLSKAILSSMKNIPSSIGSAVMKPIKAIGKAKPKFKPEDKDEENMIESEKVEKQVSPEEPRVRFASSIIAPIKAWYRRLEHEEKRFLSKKTVLPHSMHVESMKNKMIPLFKEEKISSTLLTEEVDKIKGIMEEKKKFEIYQPSYFGSVANTLVRKFTFYIIDKFPSVFKKLYDSLRLANIKVLSNTYVNIMMFSVLLCFIGSLTLFSFFFLFMKNPFIIIIPKAFVMSLLVSTAAFILFYMYPSIKAKSRQKSIDTNLPFAINHVSAVSGSGVPPTKMFKLLVESAEYGEVATELGKVVEYVDLFGYDLLTAIRSVSLNVPSEALKEFLEGIISTVESGSEIKDYLKQKASEAMLAYELERQKYLETISTYSDVYTGILIAAPLFFIVALSLVSMLGGTIGGMDINLIIVVGAYIIIPFMNILFIIFIELTQPEV